MLKKIVLLTLPWIAFAYENIALQKIAWQLHPYENKELTNFMDASKAVDGLKTNLSFSGYQCTESANEQYEAQWRVDLGAVLGIHNITMYYRTDNLAWGPTHGYVGRFLGFSVYISNTTEMVDGKLCFQDNQQFTKNTIPAVLTLNCTHHGRYVIYYNNRMSNGNPLGYSEYAYNELCEFEVYGCPLDQYGETCSQCPVRCNNSLCHIETGECFSCEDGYQGQKCEEECRNKKYGAGCSENCGHCLNGEQCNHVNGTCNNGCEAGFYKPRCKRGCLPTFYGRNCLQNCSENCYESKTCDRKTGVCNGGCVEGWKPPLCNKECDASSYGSNCSFLCGQCNKGVPCNKKNGRCLSGCASGYEGIYCNKTCAHSYYGPDCNLTCSISCFNQTCDAKSGECLKGSAQDNGENGNSITPVAIGGSIGVLFVVIVAVVVILCRKRGQQTNQHSQHQRKTSMYF